MMLERTPDRISPVIREFCRSVCADQAPLFVPVNPLAGADINSCFDTVVRQRGLEGGDIVYGWAIWTWPNVWLIAEHHAVWRHLGGFLVDITPKANGATRVVFLPDPDRTYDFAANRRINNIWKPLKRDPEIQRYIDARRQRFEYEEESTVCGALDMRVNRDKYDALKMSEQVIMLGLLRKYLGRGEPCPCGSGERFGRCCRPSIKAP
jgi:hypothetical protein